MQNIRTAIALIAIPINIPTIILLFPSLFSYPLIFRMPAPETSVICHYRPVIGHVADCPFILRPIDARGALVPIAMAGWFIAVDVHITPRFLHSQAEKLPGTGLWWR